MLKRRPVRNGGLSWAHAICALSALLAAGCPSQESSSRSNRTAEAQTVELIVPDVSSLPGALRPVVDEWAAQTGHHVVIRVARDTTIAESSGKPVRPPRPSADDANDDPQAGDSPQGEGVAAQQDDSEPDGRLVILPFSHVSAWEAAAANAARTPDSSPPAALAPIPPEMRGDAMLAWLDFFAGLRHISVRGSEPVLAPLKAPVLVLYYRRDLLDAAELKPPQTWDDYERLVASLPRWAPGKTAVEPWAPSFRATMFIARALGYSRHVGNYSLFFDIQNGEPLIDSQGFVRALLASKRILEHLPREVLTMTPRDCRNEFLAGRAALAIACEESLEAALRRVTTEPTTGSPTPRGGAPPEAAATRSDTAIDRPKELVAGFVALPGSREMFNVRTGKWEERPDGAINRPTLIGFGSWAMVVPTRRTEGDLAAWDLAAFLSMQQDADTFPPELKGLCRESQVATFPDQLPPVWEAAERTRYVVTVAAELRRREVVIELPVLGSDRFRSALTDGLTEALENGAAPRDALGTVAKQWRAIRDELGARRVMNTYRLSLGLDPLP